MIPTMAIPAAAAIITGLAGAGVVMPFIRSGSVNLARLNDPLEDKRLNLLRTLRELDGDRAAGVISEDDYDMFREELEARTIAALRALRPGEQRAELAAALKESRVAGASRGAAVRSRSLTLPGVLVAIAIVAATVPFLFRAAGSRASGQLITGDMPSAAQPASLIAVFEQRVREHPEDIGARLNLAQQYLDSGDGRLATQQYLEVIKLDPMNAEANTKLGYLVYVAGLPEQGLRAVNRALEVDPNYPDALYLKGVILLQGLNRRADAAAAFQSYLSLAPFGSHRSEVERVLKSIEAGGQ